jgi:hypothetical protein
VIVNCGPPKAFKLEETFQALEKASLSTRAKCRIMLEWAVRQDGDAWLIEAATGRNSEYDGRILPFNFVGNLSSIRLAEIPTEASGHTRNINHYIMSDMLSNICAKT